MKLKNIEVDFDFLDADDVEKFENAVKNLIEKTDSNKEKELTMSEGIRIECQIINEFVDEVFGDGIAEELFNGKNNLKEHVKIFEDLMNEKIKYSKDLQAMYQRYQPNRERNYGKYSHR